MVVMSSGHISGDLHSLHLNEIYEHSGAKNKIINFIALLKVNILYCKIVLK